MITSPLPSQICDAGEGEGRDAVHARPPKPPPQFKRDLAHIKQCSVSKRRLPDGPPCDRPHHPVGASPWAGNPASRECDAGRTTTKRMSTTPTIETDTPGACPHCGRSYARDGQAAMTRAYCGECGATHDLPGTKTENKGRLFECHDCGELNITPSPGVGK